MNVNVVFDGLQIVATVRAVAISVHSSDERGLFVYVEEVAKEILQFLKKMYGPI